MNVLNVSKILLVPVQTWQKENVFDSDMTIEIESKVDVVLGIRYYLCVVIEIESEPDVFHFLEM